MQLKSEDLFLKLDARLREVEVELEDQKARNAFYSVSIILINAFFLFEALYIWRIIK